MPWCPQEDNCVVQVDERELLFQGEQYDVSDRLEDVYGVL